MLCCLAQFARTETPLPRKPLQSVSRIACAAVASLLIACGDTGGDADSELRAWVAAAEEAAENKDRGELLSKISASYSDARGNDRKRIGDVLRGLFLRQKTVALVTTVDSIDLLGGSAANLDLTVAMAGTGSTAFGLRADAYRFALELEKEDDEWRLIGARWGELGSEVR